MPRVGLVLGSGGLAGTAFHAGVLTALAELGWDARTAEVVVGTSAGATSAALLRAGFPPGDYVARVTGTPLTAEGERVLAGIPPLAASPAAGRRVRRAASPDLLRWVVRRPWATRLGTLAAAALPAGVVPTDAVAGPFAALFADRWPAASLWLCATSLDDGARVVFGRDRMATATVGEAVAASCAIPGYYQPVRIGGRRYVDGGAWSLCNADLIAGLGLDAVVVSAPMATADWPGVRWRAGVRTAARLQLERELIRLRLGRTPVLVLAPAAADRALLDGAAMDGGRRPAIARQVHDRMRRRLARDPAAVRALVGER